MQNRLKMQNVAVIPQPLPRTSINIKFKKPINVCGSKNNTLIKSIEYLNWLTIIPKKPIVPPIKGPNKYAPIYNGKFLNVILTFKPGINMLVKGTVQQKIHDRLQKRIEEFRNTIGDFDRLRQHKGILPGHQLFD